MDATASLVLSQPHDWTFWSFDRICDGCANADETEHIPSSKNTVEFLLVRQFANFGKHIKKNKEMEAEDIAD